MICTRHASVGMAFRPESWSTGFWIWPISFCIMQPSLLKCYSKQNNPMGCHPVTMQASRFVKTNQANCLLVAFDFVRWRRILLETKKNLSPCKFLTCSNRWLSKINIIILVDFNSHFTRWVWVIFSVLGLLQFFEP
jgi:hypothetical protein